MMDKNILENIRKIAGKKQAFTGRPIIDHSKGLSADFCGDTCLGLLSYQSTPKQLVIKVFGIPIAYRRDLMARDVFLLPSKNKFRKLSGRRKAIIIKIIEKDQIRKLNVSLSRMQKKFHLNVH